jgi:broad specificity phosphatase PhoE
MRIFFARHGNTFEADQKPYFVGAKEDIKLTTRGEEQGRLFGEALLRIGYIPNIIYTSPLKRTYGFSQQIIQALQHSGFNGAIEIGVDERLKEIDYGQWGGLTEEEIKEKYDPLELERWNKESIFPVSGIWNTREEELRSSVKEILKELEQYSNDKELSKRKIVYVTSNGILRTLHKILLPHENPKKVKTGSACLIEMPQREIVQWDLKPHDMQYN